MENQAIPDTELYKSVTSLKTDGLDSSSTEKTPLPQGLSGEYRVPITEQIIVTQAPHNDAPKEKEKNNITKPSRFGLRFVLLALIISSFLLGILAWAIGYFQRGGSVPVITKSISNPASPKAIDSQKGVVLLVEQEGDINRVLIQQPNQIGWTVVSRNDTTAINPALSPDGTLVVYNTKKDGGKIIAVSTQITTEMIISATMLIDLGKSSSVGEMKVCEWTPMVWNSTSNRIAFFGCGLHDNFSVAIIGTIVYTDFSIKVVPYSRLDASTTRTIEWTDDKHLYLSAPTGTIDVP